MSRKVSNQVERVKLSKIEDMDYVEVRPMSGSEKLKASALLPQSGLMAQFINEIQKLSDRDPENQLIETVEKSVKKIREIESNYNEKLLDYHRFIMESCVVKVVDEGKEEKDIRKYLKAVDDEAFKLIFKRIEEISFPTKEEKDFLEEKDETLPDN